MGDSAFDMQAASRMTSQVMEVYADDYIQTWDGILNDVQVVPLKTLAQTADVLGILGGPTSPLKGLLATVDSNTNMSKPAEGGPSAAGLAAAAEKAVMNPLNKLFGGGAKGTAAQTPQEKITAHFAAVNALVAGPPGGAPIDRVVAQVGQIQQKMSGLGTGVGETNPLDALAKSGQGDALKALQLQASTLPPPIGAMVAQVGGRSESLAVGQGAGRTRPALSAGGRQGVRGNRIRTLSVHHGQRGGRSARGFRPAVRHWWNFRRILQAKSSAAGRYHPKSLGLAGGRQRTGRRIDVDAAAVRVGRSHPGELLRSHRSAPRTAVHVDPRRLGCRGDPIHIGNGRPDARLPSWSRAQHSRPLAGTLAGRLGRHVRGSRRRQAERDLPRSLGLVSFARHGDDSTRSPTCASMRHSKAEHIRQASSSRQAAFATPSTKPQCCTNFAAAV